MHKLPRFLFLLIFIGFAPISAQKSTIYTHDLKDFNTALTLYNDKQYTSAKLIFEKVKETATTEEIQSDCAYYAANCAIRTNQSNADELMEHFVADYPTSVKQNQAYVEVAHFYFNQGNYPKALEWFDKVDESNLSRSDSDMFNFQKGYSFFNSKNKKEATTYLNKVVNSAEYGSQAKYYLGFMAYEGDDYKQATQYFDAVSTESKYKERMSYYQSDMNFKLGNFQKAIDLGEQAMSKSTPAEQSELNKIIGESYFNLKEYTKAIPYLELYKGKNGKWSNTDFYQLGFAYYQQKDFENAVSQFNKIIDGKDFVSQNGYYHLGQSYLNLNKKQEALNAFKNASEMDFDASLKEESSLNYAKLSYEIGNSYESVPAILTAFLEKYPQNSNQSEIQKLLIDSYISSKNYKEALAILEKNGTQENKLAYQKVLFYSGLQSFTDGEYQEALQRFEKAISQQKEASITARATFWKGETQFVLDDFKNALVSFKQFIGFAEAGTTPEFKNCNYNIAYVYFKMKEYDQAGNYFQNQIEKGTADKVRLHDSYLRLADCRFVTSKYWPAMDAYNKVIDMKSVDADYAAFQKGISYGFVNKPDKKIEDLEKFAKAYATSQYADDALYELGNTYVNQNQDSNAITTYDKLINNYKSSSYVAKAILKQGLIYYNGNKEEQALVKFKKVVAEYPNSPESLEAVSTARLIYVDNGKVDEYADWVKTLSFVEVSNADLDNDTYESAEKQYLQNNAKQAISGFTSYVSKFPNGLHALKANFYLAQLYFADNLENNAIKHYEFVISKPRNEFTEQALARLCQVHLKAKNYDSAIPVLQRLETEAEFPQNTTYAQSNLMKSYYEKEDFANAVVYADKVLKNDKIEDRIKSDAQIIVARSAIKTNDEAKAKEAYDKLNKIAKGELKAEALYYDAYFKNKEGKFDASNKVVEKIAVDYSGYKYFGSKALIIMAKNYFSLEDSFQATEILQSVIDNFTEFEDVTVEAQKELDFIKAEEAKRNSSITN